MKLYVYWHSVYPKVWSAHLQLVSTPLNHHYCSKSGGAEAPPSPPLSTPLWLNPGELGTIALDVPHGAEFASVWANSEHIKL